MNVLKALREAAGITQVELAARAGISSPTYQEIEAGDASPSLRSLEAIATALVVSPAVVVSGFLSWRERKTIIAKERQDGATE